ncbi:hypothetical protein EVAR_49772_1 [Eumeta japonica]|uniref:Uncharacterized protein n=1 Tax=Eumeta variegata TaxID=151549 RepID=A0A4C1Y5L9_EUMVA|nr:hypothetical protein EVAR_49772_1 [Eumeta japonica]
MYKILGAALETFPYIPKGRLIVFRIHVSSGYFLWPVYTRRRRKRRRANKVALGRARGCGGAGWAIPVKLEFPLERCLRPRPTCPITPPARP